MATNSFSRGLQTFRSSVAFSKDPLTQCLAPRLSRTMATQTELPSTANLSRHAHPSMFKNTANNFQPPSATSVLTTIYQFPSMEPLRFENYPSNHLHLPLRRDLLHRAVIFEGDATRQGTASTKNRYEVHGSHRKIRPQKGSGRARLGTRQSPMLKGGGKSFGPHPRDFSTGLPKKMYDLAWRTALSYRYRKGELIVCEDGMDIEELNTKYVRSIFDHNGWGNENGRSLVITGNFRKNLFGALEDAGDDGRCEMVRDVDVKDLLELGRIIIEKKALDKILAAHKSDLGN